MKMGRRRHYQGPIPTRSGRLEDVWVWLEATAIPLWIPAIPDRSPGHAFDRRNDGFGGRDDQAREGAWYPHT